MEPSLIEPAGVVTDSSDQVRSRYVDIYRSRVKIQGCACIGVEAHASRGPGKRGL